MERYSKFHTRWLCFYCLHNYSHGQLRCEFTIAGNFGIMYSLLGAQRDSTCSHPKSETSIIGHCNMLSIRPPSVYVGIIYYNSKAKETLNLTPADHCHVKMTPISGVQYNTVDCEGICKTTTCMLYSRPKGSEARWVRTTPGHQEDTTREYRCFCHDPNRKEGDF